MTWIKAKYKSPNMKCPWCGSDQMGYTEPETVQCYVCFNKTDAYEAMKCAEKVSVDIETNRLSYWTYPYNKWKADIMNQYDKRKQLSLLTKEVENIDKLRQEMLVDKESKAKEIAKLQTELRIEELSKSVIKTTASNKDFEQIEVTGVAGRAYRIQLREPEKGTVVASFFHKL